MPNDVPHAPTKTQRLAEIEYQLGLMQQHLHGISSSLARLDAHLTQLGEKIMAVAADLKAALKALDDETTLVAQNIATLAARIKNSMSDQEVADVQADFATLGERLKVLATDPTVPVPPVPPQLKKLRAKP